MLQRCEDQLLLLIARRPGRLDRRSLAARMPRRFASLTVRRASRARVHLVGHQSSSLRFFRGVRMPRVPHLAYAGARATRSRRQAAVRATGSASARAVVGSSSLVSPRPSRSGLSGRVSFARVALFARSLRSLARIALLASDRGRTASGKPRSRVPFPGPSLSRGLHVACP